MEDIVLRGYHIPKNTNVIPLLYSVHMDPEVWSNPAQFDPERFLDNEGNVTNRDLIIPFGIGKIKILYLYLTALSTIGLNFCTVFTQVSAHGHLISGGGL